MNATAMKAVRKPSAVVARQGMRSTNQVMNQVRLDGRQQHVSSSSSRAGTQLVQKARIAQEVRGWQLRATGNKNAIVKAAAADEPEEKKIFGMSMISLGKFVSLAFMFFCILFNYTILRDTKDVLVVTAPGSGAEIIPFFEDLAQPPVGLWFHVAVLQALERHGTSEAVLHHHLPVPCVLHVVRLRDLPAQGLHPPLRRHERRARRGGG
mmetsp:Transcript_9002/g.27296  ORF Transcript_9002/g.27296 Transcript_9002/m.27296 type:complete len:209 (-) Transcript_9002:1294-1920(-)